MVVQGTPSSVILECRKLCPVSCLVGDNFPSKMSSLAAAQAPQSKAHLDLLDNLDSYLIFLNFGTPPHYLGL